MLTSLCFTKGIKLVTRPALFSCCGDKENRGFLRLQSQGPGQAKVGNPSKSVTSVLPYQVCDLCQERTLPQLEFFLEELRANLYGTSKDTHALCSPLSGKWKGSNAGSSTPSGRQHLTPLMTRPAFKAGLLGPITVLL